MGPVKESYLFYIKAGDQFTTEFALSPPYFSTMSITNGKREQYQLEERIDQFVKDNQYIQPSKNSYKYHKII
jgi:hypothetical protein